MVSTVVSLAETWIEIFAVILPVLHMTVVSLAETWIEIENDIIFVTKYNIVVSLAETWIEIREMKQERTKSVSSPLRRRGLKLRKCCITSFRFESSPLRRRGLKF